MSGSWSCAQFSCTWTAGATANVRDLSRYQDGDVFVAAADSLDSAMMMVPLAVIADGSASPKLHPFFVYHRDGASWDADSLLNFLAHYDAKRVVAAAGLPTDLGSLLQGKGYAVKTISATEAHAYWSSLSRVVYAAGPAEVLYAAAFMAASSNAPLIVKGSAPDSSAGLAGKEVLLVNATCPAGAAKCTTLAAAGDSASLRAMLLSAGTAPCSRVLAFNPTDLGKSSIPLAETMTTEHGSKTVNTLFGQSSLMAPYLAVARRELLLPINSSSKDYKVYDAAIKDTVTACAAKGVATGYLTILASPYQIPYQLQYTWEVQSRLNSLDTRVYANTDQDPFVELAVGRIMGLTVTDVSALINRSLFYSDLKVKQNALYHFPIYSTNGIDGASIGKFYGKVMPQSGFGYTQSTGLGSVTASMLQDAAVFLFAGHGNVNGLENGLTSGSLQGTALPPLIVLQKACSTCNFEGAGSKAQLFCLQLARHGAMLVLGSTDDTPYSHEEQTLLWVELMEGKTIGEAFKNTINKGAAILDLNLGHVSGPEKWAIFYLSIILGDPLFQPGVKNSSYGANKLGTTQLDASHLQLDFTLPEQKVIVNAASDGRNVFEVDFGLVGRSVRTQQAGGSAAGESDYTWVSFPFETPAGKKYKAVTSLTVAVGTAAPKTLAAMPIYPGSKFLTDPSFYRVTLDRASTGSSGYLFAMHEMMGALPDDPDGYYIDHRTTIPARTYRVIVELQ